MAKYLTFHEATEYLHVSASTLYDYIKQGLHHIKPESGPRLFTTDTLNAFMKKKQEEKEGYITLKEASNILKISLNRLYAYIKRGMPFYRIGGHGIMRVKEEEIVAWIAGHPVLPSGSSAPPCTILTETDALLSNEELRRYMGWSVAKYYYYLGRGMPCFRETVVSPLRFDIEKVREWLKTEEDDTTGYLTVAEAQAYKKITRETFYRWVAEGLAVKRFRPEGPLYVLKSALDSIQVYGQNQVALPDRTKSSETLKLTSKKRKKEE